MTDKQQQNQSQTPSKDQGQRQTHKKHWQKRGQQGRADYQAKKKDPEEIPVLKYGPANNFTKFKEALSKKALKKYGNLGKLIKLGKYYEPEEPNIADYELDPVNDIMGINRANDMEDMKEYRKELMRMRNDRPKLYALIYQYQAIRQGAFENIITYKERFNAALQGNRTAEESERDVFTGKPVANNHYQDTSKWTCNDVYNDVRSTKDK
mmetsp:Transcript_13264/g.19025  ORF Transcript_13264/g.19025 Transcript_13264/m.19025 type:complete len:209 (-) Transcript_13264:18-644(-)